MSGDGIAVLLNANARAVRRSTVDTIREVLPGAQTFLSRSRDDAQHHVDRIVERGYGLVLCGGGDGSVVTLLNLLRQRVPSFPRLGLLRLGTGNAWATAMGARGLRWTLGHLRHADPARLPIDRFDLVEVEGMVTHFAGAGWDARVVNDFNDLMRGVGLKAGKSVLAYLTALFSKTVPAAALEDFLKGDVEVQMRLLSGPCIRITSEDGEVPMQVEPGTVLHQGSVSVLGCATTEHYGFGFKAFPHARRRPGMMHFRSISMPLAQALVSIPQLWRGTLTGEPLVDYLVQDIEMEFSRPLDFQVGGDAMGKRQRVRMRLADEGVEVVDFRRLSA
jgi:diacylglycerol kinase family enzyme